jgi:hypothetical protein
MSSDRVAELERKVEALTRHVLDLEAVQEIRKTQHKYGYYIDKCLYLLPCPPCHPVTPSPSTPASLPPSAFPAAAFPSTMRGFDIGGFDIGELMGRWGIHISSPG